MATLLLYSLKADSRDPHIIEYYITQPGPETVAALQSKHPSPSRSLNFPPPPDRTYSPLTCTVEDVSRALGSFYNGSAAGLDGIRPSHLKELTSSSAGENGPRLMECLTKLCNFLFSGQLNKEVCPYLYGASLCALSKKDGGLRPIAVGSTLRRLSAKIACYSIKESMADYLQPHQLGFGTRQGCEGAIHATRSFVMDFNNADSVIIKLDIKNAFNSLERDVLLNEVKDIIPSLYPFLDQVYGTSSKLFFKDNLILSQVGVQQGDPLGPLIFSLAIHKAIINIQSPLNVWYLDDGTLGGEPEIVKQDLITLIPRLRDLGLEVNSAKCEFFPCSDGVASQFQNFLTVLPGLSFLSRANFDLLGSPIFAEGIAESVEKQRRNLEFVNDRLKFLNPHVALTLLRMCLGAPKFIYLLRTSPVWLFPALISAFDECLRSSVSGIINVSLNEVQWSQAALPIRHGGLGVRRVGDLGLPAFLSSGHAVVDLVAKILNTRESQVVVPFLSDASDAFAALHPGVDLPDRPWVQRSWDDIGAKCVMDRLLGGATGADLARLRAVSQPESGAWLQALPSPHFGTLLDDVSLRVAVALRLGCDVCEPHLCICGSRVEADGHHALSCRRCEGRFPRHHALNDIIRRALVSANIPCVLEPPGLSRTDGKRPDGLTLVPWEKGRCLLWDATCVSTFAACHLGRTTLAPGAAAETAALKKHTKYSALEAVYHFVPFAVETAGSWGSEAKSFVAEVGRRLRVRTNDPRSGSFLVQKLALAIQRGNAASVMGTFPPGLTLC
ncbi:hypothetical protein ABMA28_006551 [Loxostege sticticalis]|uniref:Reverse transcriptase domain-containing protein n=1 Tax=Loxostege sticticalis TaxID=481309 RepID=A0ABD0SLS5_LOXSC